MAQVRLRDRGRRLEARGYPRRVTPAIIEQTWRAVLRRMAAEGDPDAIAAWRQWAEEAIPQPAERPREPLRATMAEMLAMRVAG